MAISEILCQGTYIGDQPMLKGKTALIHWKVGEHLLGVQFDDLKGLPPELTHSNPISGWPKCRQQDFAVDLDGSLICYMKGASHDQR